MKTRQREHAIESDFSVVFFLSPIVLHFFLIPLDWSFI